MSFPRVRTTGAPYERGVQYGQQARERIENSLRLYQEVFQHYAGWDWRQVGDYAETFVLKIEAYRPHFIEEIQGIADGAGLARRDVLALNVRTEIMFAAVARAAASECTAFVALPEATQAGHVLIGQNWDWKPATSETLVILEVEPDQGPSFVTVVEAGLLAKAGMNDRGIGLVTNALVSDQDRGEPGVPYHAVLRAILESENMSQALGAITRHPRSSSANYLIAHRDGEAINVEAAPGDYARVFMDFPEAGIYSHANHFICPGFNLKDVGMWNGPSSPFRQRRMHRLLEQQQGGCSVEALQKALADHFNLPRAICAHPDLALPRPERYATTTSVIMDLSAVSVWVADGNPCQAQYHLLDLAWM
jgi:isopenicillin-N N-acyltransferase-like protein